MKLLKILMAAAVSYSFVSTGAFANDNTSDTDKSITQDAADHVESAGKGTWVEPVTDAAADKIRSYDNDD